jgi:hypothetical protein
MAAGQGVNFGAVLRQHRRAAGLAQEALAERAGLTAQTISALERGVRRWPIPAPRSQALRCSRAWLPCRRLGYSRSSMAFAQSDARGTLRADPDADQAMPVQNH